MSRPISTESRFRAIAHLSRRRIIDLLLRGEKTAGELAEHFHHSRPVLSKHLRVLEVTGLIVFDRRGTQLVYRIVPQAFDPMRQWMARVPRRPVSR